jgi:hypothetical protein
VLVEAFVAQPLNSGFRLNSEITLIIRYPPVTCRSDPVHALRRQLSKLSSCLSLTPDINALKSSDEINYHRRAGQLQLGNLS